MSLDLCRWKVQVSVYCARRISAHLRCTQCSISFLFFCGRCRKSRFGFVSTSFAFMRSRASHSAGLHDRLAPKMVNRAPLLGAGGIDTICTAIYQNRCDSSTACTLCPLESRGSGHPLFICYVIFFIIRYKI